MIRLLLFLLSLQAYADQNADTDDQNSRSVDTAVTVPDYKTYANDDDSNTCFAEDQNNGETTYNSYNNCKPNSCNYFGTNYGTWNSWYSHLSSSQRNSYHDCQDNDRWRAWYYASGDASSACSAATINSLQTPSILLSVPAHASENPTTISLQFVSNKSTTHNNGNHYGLTGHEGIAHVNDGNYGIKGLNNTEGNDNGNGHSHLNCNASLANTTVNVNFKYAYVNPSSGTLPVRIIGNTAGAAEQSLSTITSTSVSVTLDANGKAQGIILKYADVGSVKLIASYTANGSTQTASSTFVVSPDHLYTSLNSSLVQQGTSPALFSIYSGQSSAFTIKAKNASGNTTPNYSGSYAPSVTITDGTAIDIAIPDFTSITIAGSSFTAGVATPSNLITYTFPNKKTAPTQISVRATDSNGISSINHDTAWVRSGRADLNDAKGPAKSNLSMKVRIEYWKSNQEGWQLNTDDSSSTVSILPSLLSSAYSNTFNNTGVTSGSGYSLNSIASPGLFYFKLSPPGNANAGFLKITANVPSYLETIWKGTTAGDPSAIAGFIDDGTGTATSSQPRRILVNGVWVYENVDVDYSGINNISPLIGIQDLR